MDGPLVGGWQTLLRPLPAKGIDPGLTLTAPGRPVRPGDGPRLRAAIADGLTFGGNNLETGTTSYRLAHARPQRAGQAAEP